MRMKGSGDDCNCETQTRGDGSDIGVRSNEMRSRIQGIADSHDSSSTLRLSEESKNKAESTDHFLSQTNSSIDSTSQEVTIKQATLSVKRESILFSRSSVHSTTNDILHFHNVKASIELIPHLIRTIEMKSSLNQWNQQRYYQDAEGSKMVKHNPFQMIIEKRENPNESFQLHSQGFYKQ